MGKARVVLEVNASPSDAERLWNDSSRRSAFIDGFAAVVECGDDWPLVGSTLVWRSGPQGRGRVSETVIRYEPHAGQSVEVQDDQLYGVQSVSFTAVEDGTVVALELDYRLISSNPLKGLLDLLFVRRAIAESLGRTLARFGRELDSDRDLLR